MNLAVRALYQLLLPLLCLGVAPFWLFKMARRGGFDKRLWQRLGIFDRPSDSEPRGVIYVHAVSVGEVMMALRLVREWLQLHPEERFVIATTTSTGFQLAEQEAPESVRVIYSPVDHSTVLRRTFRRFKPALIVLIDSELWPGLIDLADRDGLPVALVNARLSQRSARRFGKLKFLAAPILSKLKLVCLQVDEHVEVWSRLGVAQDVLEVTGSLKFDLEGSGAPRSRQREEFKEMLASFGSGRPVVLAASTHRGEEVLIAEAALAIPGALAVVLPRHAERREAVRTDLERAGHEVVLRSCFKPPTDLGRAVLVVDSTGEQRDWIAHADVVVIGKSFLARGGQNPVEAIAARVPVVCGPHMDNFEPLISELRDAGGIESTSTDALESGIRSVLESVPTRRARSKRALEVLERHRGATVRVIERLRRLLPLGGH